MGGKLKFTGVKAQTSSTVTLSIQYATADSRVAQVSINGGTPIALNFPSTKDWVTTGTLQISVALNAGDNTIEFSNSSGYAPDIDLITFK